MGKGNSRASKKRAAKKAKAAIKSGNAVIDPSSSVVANVVSTNNSKGGQKVRIAPTRMLTTICVYTHRHNTQLN
jgi:hypothetical protein